MKKLLLIFVFLTSCVPAISTETPTPEIIYIEVAPTPEIIYIEITSTPKPAPKITAGCEYYFNSWEASGAAGMFFPVDDYYLIFARGEGAALHEVGHIADNGTSDLPEFEEAVVEYLSDCIEQPCWRIGHFYDQDMLHEVYAEFYMWDILYSIPQEFEVFYAR